MPWYLYHALKQLFPSGRFFSFFSLMSIMGVMLGVCVLIIVQSVMNGFGEGIRQRLTETQGDIRIRSNEVIYDWWEVLDTLQAQDEVVAAAPFAEGVIMLQHENRPQFPFVRGVDPFAEEDVVPIEKFLTMGDMDDFDDEGVFLGEGLAYALKAGPGSTVEVFTPLMLEALKQDEVLLPREFKVVGLFRTGSPQVDGNTMITTLRVMQELYGLEDGVHGLVLKLRPGLDAFEYSVDLERELLRPGLQAVSWKESNEEFLFVIEQEKRVISFIIIFIILVASFSIAIALMMAVIRKTREIGLLVAMGGRPHQVAYSFCFQGFVIGFVGCVSGILLALVALHFRTPILGAYTSFVAYFRTVVAEGLLLHLLLFCLGVIVCFGLGTISVVRLFRRGKDVEDLQSRVKIRTIYSVVQLLLWGGIFLLYGPISSVEGKLSYSQINFLGQYDVYEIPVHYLASDFIMVTCFALVISTLAGLLPALRAARLKPADALRSE